MLKRNCDKAERSNFQRIFASLSFVKVLAKYDNQLPNQNIN
jgi:hypothetical protein